MKSRISNFCKNSNLSSLYSFKGDKSSPIPFSSSVQEQRKKAQKQAQSAIANYWTAIEGTLDKSKTDKAVDNALVGTPQDILKQINDRFHKDDRVMLWFDFNNHNNEEVKNSMKVFMEEVASKL